jgi:hypothetical protein
MFQSEHKALLEKTQYLIDHSRIEDDYGDEVDRLYPATERKINNDRNRFFTQQVKDEIKPL